MKTLDKELAQLLLTCYNWVVYKFEGDEYDDRVERTDKEEPGLLWE